MAEVEFGGVKFRGGKMVAIIMALSTLVGGLYGGFEVYKDYMDMKKKILSYTAPDMSGFDKKLAVMNETMGVVTKEMASVRLRVSEIQTIARDLREDQRSDGSKVYSAISAVGRRSRATDADTRAAMRQAEKSLRAITSAASARFDGKINGVDTKLDALEARLSKRLRDALNNPLLTK